MNDGIQTGQTMTAMAEPFFHLFRIYCLVYCTYTYDILTILINVQHAKLLRFQIGYTATCSFTEAAYHSNFMYIRLSTTIPPK